jgi:hypothetical protein
MAAVIGVITEIFAESAAAFEDVPPERLADVVREVIADLGPASQGQAQGQSSAMSQSAG